jgi:hypothetical protein
MMIGVRVAAVATFATVPWVVPAEAAPPVEGYHDRGDRIGCVMYQHYDRHGNAVKCGRNGGERGLLLRSAGSARYRPWSWPDAMLGKLFFTATYGQTLYLRGGTAKLDGDDTILRCTFRKRPTVRVRCLNGDGFGIRVTRNRLRRIQS